MNDQTAQLILEQLARIAAALGTMSPDPGYRMPLAAFVDFNWGNIGAAVVEHDRHGATVVMWNGRMFKRRSNTKYGNGIWYSRGAGRDEDGSARYSKLITFSDAGSNVEPLPAQIVRDLRQQVRPADLDHPARPNPGAQPAPTSPDPAPTAADPAAAQQEFYRLMPTLIQSGTLNATIANQLTTKAGSVGFAAVLAELQQLAAQEPAAAQTA